MNQMGRGYRGGKNNKNNAYSVKRQSKLDSEPAEYNYRNDQSKLDVKKKRQYFRKGNTTNLPDKKEKN